MAPRQRLCFGLLMAGGIAAAGRLSGQETAGLAVAGFASDAGSYNLIALGGGASFSNYTQTQGGLAVDGNLSVSGGELATDATSSGDPTLYVTGTLTLSGTTKLETGYASLPGETSAQYTWDATTRALTSSAGKLTAVAATGYAADNPLQNPGPNFNFGTVISQMTEASTSLASAAVDGTISVSSSSLTFTPNATPAAGSTVIFQLDASKISGSTYNSQSFTKVTIDVPTDVNYVINVINAPSSFTLFGSGVTMKSGTNDSQLLWNIEGTTTVTLGGGKFFGSILAPSATVDNGGALVSGQVVADAFNDSGKALDFTAFDSAAVVAPEPAGYALCGAGLCGLAIIAGRRLRK